MKVEESSEIMHSDGNAIMVEMRFLISSKMAGLIIGKGGDNIKKLRKEYPAKINIPDSSGPERVLIIEAELATIVEVLDKIIERQVTTMAEGTIDLRLLVHSSQVGCIIGRQGQKIKELRENSGLRTLKVYQMLCPCSSDRVIQLVGDAEKVTGCLSQVSELLEEAPPRGTRHNYDARNCDESCAAEYGGWGTPGSTLGLMRTRTAGPTNAGGVATSTAATGYNQGFYGSAGRNGNAMFNDVMHGRMAPPPPQAQGATGDATAAAMMAAGMMRGMPGRVGMNMLNATTTTQVSVSDKMIGAIMGRAGSRINQVRQESGADIKISNQEPGMEDRIITITGTPDQIQNAQFLLQVCVKRYGDHHI